ncbi:PTS fructose transporter subunit IIABC, partial [Intestinibacter sp.]
MRITDLLSKESIKLDLSSKTKSEVIDEMVDLVDASGNLENKAEYKEAILAREELSTTAVGEGIAIPHAKTKAVKKACLAAGVTKEGIDYEAFDGSLSNLFFMIAAPDGANNTHLEVLSRLSTILMDPDFKNSLINSKSVDEFLSLIDKKETEKFPEEQSEVVEESKTEQTSCDNDGYPQVLAVTACPTGIAHTFMAAESLSNKGAEKGITVKVETNGSGGIKNALTKAEIEHAKCIIVAADKKVEMNRFDGKKVIITKVADGIHKADELLERAMNEDAPVYHADSAADASEGDSNENESIGRKIYKDLMNGVSHMLPFVVGGGILIAIAFLLDDYSINPSNFGMNTPIAAFFKTVGGQAFGFMLPILAGYIAMSIADRPGLAVGFIGGVIAKDGYAFNNLMNFADSNPVSSGFLGALLAGFVAGYLVLFLKKIFSKLPQSLEGIKPVLLYPVFGILLIAIFMMAVNPIMGAINTGLNNFLASMSGSSKILLGAVLAGMMAIDMGGPFNKAAYVFGTAQLTVANAGPEQFGIMAAVMIGGMVPPIAIALATTFFKDKFTESERKSGIVNYVMGLSFITEGAIPFAAGDPARVIPSCVVGSAIAGALSMAFG